MPGTIQVSVLDLLGLPSSSISVKVSMGSREHQVWDRGEFSFPLTTFQEDLIVTLYDIEGNELSRTGVNTKLVVEKGVWNDVFPLEGGGHLLMKLQFLLSKEDRQKIQRMRESARKRKQEELLLSNEMHPEIVAVARASFNHEVTDSRESIGRMDAGPVAGKSSHIHPVASPYSYSTNLESGPEYGKNKTDGETDFSQEHKVSRHTSEPSEENRFLHLTKATQQILRKRGKQLPPSGETSRPTSPFGDLGYSHPASKNIVAPTEEISSAATPSQKDRSLHPTESIDTLLPLKEIITRSKSSPTLSTIKQTALRRTLRNNGKDSEETSSEASRQFFTRNVHSPSDNINKQPSIKHIVFRKTSKNNETRREGTPSETTHETPAKNDSQSFITNASTKTISSQNQIQRTTEQVVLDKTPRDNERDTDGTSSMAPPEEIKIFPYTGTPPQLKEMNDNQSSSKAVSTRVISPKDAPGNSSFFLRKKALEDRIHVNENQASIAKTSSSVRKLISAFESSLAQELLPRAKVSMLKPHLKTEVSLKELIVNYAKMEVKGNEQIAETDADSYNVSQPLQINVEQEEPYLNKVYKQVSLKVPSIKEVNVEEEEKKLVSVGTPLEVNVQQNMQQRRSQTQISYAAQAVRSSDQSLTSQIRGLLKVLNPRADAAEGHTSSKQVDSNTEYKKEKMDRQKKLLEEVAVTSKVDTRRSSDSVLVDPVSEDQTHTDEAAERLPTSYRSRQLDLLGARSVAVAENSSSVQFEHIVQHAEENISRQETLVEKFVVTSEAEVATTSGRILDRPLTKEHAHSLHYTQEAFAPGMLEKRKWRNYGDESEMCDIPLEKHKSLKYLGPEQSDNQVMGSWILPHEERPLCITTGSKQMMDLVAHSNTYGSNSKTISPRGVEREVAMGGNVSTNVNETETDPHDLRKPRLERSNDNTDFGGFIGQALKIGIMVAFGTLVLVARPK